MVILFCLILLSKFEMCFIINYFGDQNKTELMQKNKFQILIKSLAKENNIDKKSGCNVCVYLREQLHQQ